MASRLLVRGSLFERTEEHAPARRQMGLGKVTNFEIFRINYGPPPAPAFSCAKPLGARALKIATWNVNSIKARLPRVLEWLDEARPDIALLQEIKTVDEGFPRLEIEELGYNVAVAGQKTYNGVAILSKFPIEDVTCALPGDPGDEQARYLEAVTGSDGLIIRVASIYLANATSSCGCGNSFSLG